jgi:type IV pilus assembly protein PilO
MMRRDFRLQKRLIIAAVALLVAADVALAVYSWNTSASPRRIEDLNARALELKILQGDVDRAKAIKASMPAIQADCDKFERMLFSASTGYSSITADLDSMAQKAGAQVQDISFRQNENAARGLTGIEITSTVNGNYSSVVHFVNALQRSQNVYILDALNLAGDSQNPSANSQIKVTLHLQTYFRTAA